MRNGLLQDSAVKTALHDDYKKTHLYKTAPGIGLSNNLQSTFRFYFCFEVFCRMFGELRLKRELFELKILRHIICFYIRSDTKVKGTLQDGGSLA